MGLSIYVNKSFSTSEDFENVLKACESDEEYDELFGDLYQGASLDCSYSRFGNFRNSLAKEVGWNLSDFPGYDRAPSKNWSDMEGTSAEVFIPLFNHSDCDGFLDSNDGLGEMAEQLREISDRLETCCSDYAKKLADILTEAHQENSILIFA